MEYHVDYGLWGWDMVQGDTIEDAIKQAIKQAPRPAIEAPGGAHINLYRARRAGGKKMQIHIHMGTAD